MAGRKSAGKGDQASQRAEKFWDLFRFTENGKPKSSLGVYSFSLSIAYAIVYALCYEGAIRLLTSPLSGLAVFWQNLIISLSASAAGTALCCLPHRFFQDKRLVFRSYLWLVVYALAILVIMLLMVAGQGGTAAFLRFFGWFIALPVALGTLISFLLMKKSAQRAQPPAQEEPEWKKYVNRR